MMTFKVCRQFLCEIQADTKSIKDAAKIKRRGCLSELVYEQFVQFVSHKMKRGAWLLVLHVGLR